MLTPNRNCPPDTRPYCTQPACLLKQEGMSQGKLADCLVELLAGHAPEVVEPGAEAICPRSDCAICAMRVMKGSPAFFTGDEWAHLDALGQWHHRRERRRARIRH